jgi:hypothetical protein
MSDDIPVKSLKKSKILLLLILMIASVGVVLTIIFIATQLSDSTVSDGGGG